jgi:phage recombination protein Bet
VTGTSSALAVREQGALAIEAGQTRWSEMQLAAFGQLGIADAPEGDKAVLLHVSQRTGLDPFSRQIYMIGRSEKKNVKQPGGRWEEVWSTKYTIQTGIEGFRVIRGRAERAEGIRGILSRPVFYNGQGDEFKVWFFKSPPAAVELTYTVRDRNGSETPYTSILRYDEYVQTKKQTANGVDTFVLVSQWATKPTHMLEKCTEADVYRKAFPQDYSGVDLDDAMPAPDPDAPPIQVQSARIRVTAAEARERRPQTVTAVATTVAPDASPAQPTPPPATAAAPPQQGAGEAPSRPVKMATDGQVGAIRGHFTRLGYTDSDDDRVSRLADTAKLAGHDGDLLTTGDLTGNEAAQVIRALARLATAQDLVDLLDDGEAPGGE